MGIRPLNIGIIGLGTVGTGLIELLSKNKKIIFSRTERAINVLAICAKNKNKKRKIMKLAAALNSERFRIVWTVPY